jgi:hypothetical protein
LAVSVCLLGEQSTFLLENFEIAHEATTPWCREGHVDIEAAAAAAAVCRGTDWKDDRRA